MKFLLRLMLAQFVCAGWLTIQAAGQSIPPVTSMSTARLAGSSDPRIPSDLRLGPNDELTIWALGVTEIGDKPLRIDSRGVVDIPLVGAIQVSGLTVSEFKEELQKRLAKYVQHPEATVSVAQFQSRPVSVVGAVVRPGVYQVGGRTRLLEVVSVSGGLAPDAGRVLRVSREADSACPPLSHTMSGENTEGASNVASSPSYSVLEVRRLLEGDEASNVTLCPRDVVSVPRADMVYVVGEVQKPGAFAINERGSYTALQALSLAGGTTRTAKPTEARILRDWLGPNKREIAVDLKRLMSAKGVDVPLEPGDVLFIPDSIARTAGRRVMEAALQLAVGIVIFR